MREQEEQPRGLQAPLRQPPPPAAGLGVHLRSVRTQSRELILGASLSEFMDKLSMDSVGGARTRLRNQMRRLFNAHVQLVFYKDKLGEASVSSSVADRTEFWWNPNRPDEPMLWAWPCLWRFWRDRTQMA